MVKLSEFLLFVLWATTDVFQYSRALEAPDVTCMENGLVKIMASPGNTARVVMAMTSGQPCDILRDVGGFLINNIQLGVPVHVLLEHGNGVTRYDVIHVVCGGRVRREAANGTEGSAWHGLPPEGGEAKVDVMFSVGLKYANNSELNIDCGDNGVLKVSNPDPASYKSVMAFDTYGDDCNSKMSKTYGAVIITGCSLYKDIRISFGKRLDHGSIIGGLEMNKVYLINCASIWNKAGDKPYDDFEDLGGLMDNPNYYYDDQEFNSASTPLGSLAMLAFSIFTAFIVN